MSHRSSYAGFTMVELLVTMLVTGIVVGVVMDFMANSLVQSTVQSARSALLSDAETALDVAQNDIRLSAAADDQNRWPDDNAPVAGDTFSWKSNSSTLVLATAAEDSAGNILFADPSKYITDKNNYIYFVQGGNLYKRILAAPVDGNKSKTTCPAATASASCPADQLMAHSVQSFSVRYLDGHDNEVQPSDARSIELTLQLQDTKYGHDVTASYTTRTVFRND